MWLRLLWKPVNTMMAEHLATLGRLSRMQAPSCSSQQVPRRDCGRGVGVPNGRVKGGSTDTESRAVHVKWDFQ